MGAMTNAQWWYALAAYVKDKAENFIGFCLYVGNALEGRLEGDDLHGPR